MSTASQDLEVQLQTLQAEGATTIYKEKFTGTSTDRPQLKELLAQLQEKAFPLSKICLNVE